MESGYFRIFQDISWYFMIFHDISWYFMIFHDISWYFMIFHDISHQFASQFSWSTTCDPINHRSQVSAGSVLLMENFTSSSGSFSLSASGDQIIVFFGSEALYSKGVAVVGFCWCVKAPLFGDAKKISNDIPKALGHEHFGPSQAAPSFLCAINFGSSRLAQNGWPSHGTARSAEVGRPQPIPPPPVPSLLVWAQHWPWRRSPVMG